MPDFETVALTLGSLLAGFVNAIAGGGGLVTLPVLLGVFPQAEPAVLFGTNKAAMICGTATAAVDYARHVRLPWPTLATGRLNTLSATVRSSRESSAR